MTLRSTRIESGYTVGEVAQIFSISEEEVTEYESNPGEIPKKLACEMKRLFGFSWDAIDFHPRHPQDNPMSH